MKLNAALIRRYDRHGPRYTSYPTAVQFHSGFDAQSYRRVALLSNCGITRPRSIHVHVPFCAQPCFYCRTLDPDTCLHWQPWDSTGSAWACRISILASSNR